MARILVVDDDADVLTLVTSALSEHEIVTSHDWEGVAEHAGKVDLILLDVNLPVVDGEIVAKSLRRNFPDLKVVLFSSMDASALRRMAKSLGVAGSIPKTLDMDNLPRSLARFLRD